MKTLIRFARQSAAVLALVACLAVLGGGCQKSSSTADGFREMDARQGMHRDALGRHGGASSEVAGVDGAAAGESRDSVTRPAQPDSPTTAGATEETVADPAPASAAEIAGPAGTEPSRERDPQPAGTSGRDTGDAEPAVSPPKFGERIVGNGPDAVAQVLVEAEGADGADSPEGPREIQLLVPEKSFKVEGPEGAIRLHYSDFDLLLVLNMDPVPPDAVRHFPSWLTELDGRRVRLRGFMFPTFQEEGLKGFVLARDNDVCCFVRKPKVYDVLTVKMREGQTTNYIPNRPFDVVGNFRIRPVSFGDELAYLYAVEDATIINR